jgi:hypothetical protein
MRHRPLAAAAVLVASLALPPTVAAAPPIAGNDFATTNEDTSVSIDLFANDSDPDGDILDIAALTQPANGFVQFASPFGLIQYTPRRDYNSAAGADQFSYTVVDGNGGSATATVSVFVTAVNDPPVVFDRTATVVEGGSVVINLQPRDPDKEGCDLAFSIVTPPVKGTLGPFVDTGCSPNGDMASIEYTPNPNACCDEFFTYGVSDGTVQVNASVYISITSVNDMPVALPGNVTTTSNTPVAILLRGYDEETCELTFAITGGPTRGTLSTPGATTCGQDPAGQNEDSASITYAPAVGFSGSDAFTFTVSDGTSVSSPATVSINVVAPPTVHVGDLDATTVKGSGSWLATVTIRIDAFSHAPMSGAIVRGSWGNGLTGICTTSATGTCSVGSGSLARKIQSTTFRVTSVTIGDLVYDSSANHDPDGGSDGTTISIHRP